MDSGVTRGSQEMALSEFLTLVSFLGHMPYDPSLSDTLLIRVVFCNSHPIF